MEQISAEPVRRNFKPGGFSNLREPPIYNGERRGGTAATLRYAKKLGRELIVIHPLSLLISHIS